MFTIVASKANNGSYRVSLAKDFEASRSVTRRSVNADQAFHEDQFAAINSAESVNVLPFLHT